jgi:hypothetical protein
MTPKNYGFGFEFVFCCVHCQLNLVLTYPGFVDSVRCQTKYCAGVRIKIPSSFFFFWLATIPGITSMKIRHTYTGCLMPTSTSIICSTK